jgi:hypothetical protein
MHMAITVRSRTCPAPHARRARQHMQTKKRPTDYERNATDKGAMDKDRGNRSHIIDALTVVVFWKACRAVGDICPFFCSHHTEVLLVDVTILLEHWGRKFRTWTAELLRYPLGGRKLPASVSQSLKGARTRTVSGIQQ